MKKVFIIHENTKPIRLTNLSNKPQNSDLYVQIATDYVCCVGYIKTSDEKDPFEGQEYEEIYDHDGEYDYPNVELHNYLDGVWFETYEEGCKVLVKILQARTENDITILETFKELAEKYPEALI